MNVDFKQVFERHAWNIVLVACFLIGQFYLIEYRLGEAEINADTSKTEVIQLVSKNARAIDANRTRIHAIEVGRAADMGELRALLKGLTGQVQRLESISEQQYNLLQKSIKENN